MTAARIGGIVARRRRRGRIQVHGKRLDNPNHGRKLPVAEPSAHTEIERILEINALQQMTKSVVEAARESLVIGQA